ncbi:hypothetical protein TIFTF001_018443 [Ficus carica]|uniref:Uncharacterized protein n=1 Tax=Ficus carica TaxID=3494 RepID=A0AA88ANB8_FICCA|nr:hypothetical protein TIFTF001_018443 [Ficus carica]
MFGGSAREISTDQKSGFSLKNHLVFTLSATAGRDTPTNSSFIGSLFGSHTERIPACTSCSACRCGLNDELCREDDGKFVTPNVDAD